MSSDKPKRYEMDIPVTEFGDVTYIRSKVVLLSDYERVEAERHRLDMDAETFKARMDEHAATITRLRELLTRAARRIPKTRGAGLRGTEPNPLRVEIDAAIKEKT